MLLLQHGNSSMKPQTKLSLPQPAKRQCSTCAHYIAEASENADKQGFCRRYPPSVFLVADGSTRSSFAPVRAEFYCGEHRAVQV